MQRLGMDYVAFRAASDNWLQIVRSRGPEAVTAVYQSVLAGGAPPREGQIVSMHP